MRIDPRICATIIMVMLGVAILIKLDMKGMSFEPYGYLAMIMFVFPFSFIFVKR